MVHFSLSAPHAHPSFSFLASRICSISTFSRESALLLSDSAFSTFPYILTKHGHLRLFHDSQLQAHQPANQHPAVYTSSQWMRKEVSLGHLSTGLTISCSTSSAQPWPRRWGTSNITWLSFCIGTPVLLRGGQSHCSRACPRKTPYKLPTWKTQPKL